MKPLVVAASCTLLGVLFGFTAARHLDRPVPIPPRGIAQPSVQRVDSAPAFTPAVTDPAEAVARALSAPPSQASDEATLAALEQLAARDPVRAQAIALAQPNVRLRWEMVRATLRGWATRDPDAAAAWALSTQRVLAPHIAVEAVLEGLVPVDAARAVALVRRLSDTVAPQHRVPFGTALIAQLSRQGDFTRATQFAAAGDEAVRTDWVTMSYNIWATHQPEAAAAALATITDDTLRAKASSVVVEGWAIGNPASLAEQSLRETTSANRDLMLTEALRSWAFTDPDAAAAWVTRTEATTSIDVGLATVAKAPAFVANPTNALSLARVIDDATLRTTTIGDIVREWSGTDRRAALNYVRTTADVDDTTRASLLAQLGGS